MLKVEYEQIVNVRVENDEVIALVHQYVRDQNGVGMLREFSSWAPMLKVEG